MQDATKEVSSDQRALQTNFLDAFAANAMSTVLAEDNSRLNPANSNKLMARS